jgi:hypothetical protein
MLHVLKSLSGQERCTHRRKHRVGQANGQWFQIDLQTAQTFDQLVMLSNSDYARGYQVFVSSDGATWGSAVATGAGTSSTTSISFALQTSRARAGARASGRRTATGGRSTWASRSRSTRS